MPTFFSEINFSFTRVKVSQMDSRFELAKLFFFKNANISFTNLQLNLKLLKKYFYLGTLGIGGRMNFVLYKFANNR
jgi:hypothetical protein